MKIVDFVHQQHDRLAHSHANVVIEGLLYTVKRSWHDATIPYIEITLAVLRNNGYAEFIPVRIYPPLLSEVLESLTALAYSGATIRVEGFPYSGNAPGKHANNWIFAWIVIAHRCEILDQGVPALSDSEPVVALDV